MSKNNQPKICKIKEKNKKQNKTTSVSDVNIYSSDNEITVSTIKYLLFNKSCALKFGVLYFIGVTPGNNGLHGWLRCKPDTEVVSIPGLDGGSEVVYEYTDRDNKTQTTAPVKVADNLSVVEIDIKKIKAPEHDPVKEYTWYNFVSEVIPYSKTSISEILQDAEQLYPHDPVINELDSLNNNFDLDLTPNSPDNIGKYDKQRMERKKEIEEDKKFLKDKKCISCAGSLLIIRPGIALCVTCHNEYKVDVLKKEYKIKK